jgi:hypothetical protein
VDIQIGGLQRAIRVVDYRYDAEISGVEVEINSIYIHMAKKRSDCQE